VTVDESRVTKTIGRDRRPVEPPIDQDLAAGTAVGEYVIDSLIGRGGMATVYAAHHPIIGKRAAVKVLNHHSHDGGVGVQRFIQEARAANAIGHPSIVDIFAFGELADGRPYMVMELLDGEPLNVRLARGALPLGAALDVIEALADALQALHARDVVHRDLKPGNIFLLRPREARQPLKLLDFGIAKLVAPQSGPNRRLTQSGVIMGTPAYLSPEQALGQAIDQRADVYALGLVAFEVVLGCRAFVAGSAQAVMAMHIRDQPPAPVALWPQVPVALNALILLLLAKNPDDRPSLAEVRATVAKLKQEIDPALVAPPGLDASLEIRGRSSPAPTVDLRPVRPVEKPPRSRLTLALSVLVSVLALAVVGLGAVWLRQRAATPPAAPTTAAPPTPAPTAVQETPPPAPPRPEVAAVTPSKTKVKARTAKPGPRPTANPPAAASPSEEPAPALSSRTGSLTVKAAPWVSVLVNGAEVARETPLRRHALPAGTYRVRFDNPIMKFSIEKTVVIAAGKDQSFFVDVAAGTVSER
jgi:serine/threonine-protein kinase